MHRISMVGNDALGRATLEDLGLSVRAARAGTSSWRHETVRATYAQLAETAERMATRFDLQVHRMARLGQNAGTRKTNSLPFVPAGSVLPGMAMFDERGAYDVVVSVRRLLLDGPVLDLDIEETHNYVANGLVTHNSIYGWRGASLANVLEFEDAFPGASLIRLEQNYRSTGKILKAANAVIANNRARKGKTLWCEREEGAAIRFVLTEDEVDEARRIRAILAEHLRRGGRLDDVAVLYRTNAQSRALETELRTHLVAYEIVGGVPFYQRREVKDLLAYLRLAANPADLVAFWRVWNTPRRGLGPVVRAAVEDRMSRDGTSALEALRALAAHGELSRPARAGAESLLAVMDELAGQLDAPVDVMLTLLLERIRYLEHLSTDEQATERGANVEELLAAAAGFAAANRGTVRDFLAEAALVSDADLMSESADRVLLLTAHNAKGLEFPMVVVAGLEEGLFPHANSLEEPAKLEEERRLFYVAMTRARDRVVLTAAAYRRRHDGPRGGAVSRFVDEIPEMLLEREDFSLRARSRAAAAAARPWGGHDRDEGGGWGVAEAPAWNWSAAGGSRAAHRALGREVYHESFGRGVVMAAEGQGADLKYTVRFGTRIKKVLGRFLTEGDDGD